MAHRVYVGKEKPKVVEYQRSLSLCKASSLSKKTHTHIWESAWGLQIVNELEDQLEDIARRMAYSQGGFGPADGYMIKQETKKLIYRLHQEGHGWATIASILDKEKIPNPSGRKKWNDHLVKRIALRYRP